MSARSLHTKLELVGSLHVDDLTIIVFGTSKRMVVMVAILSIQAS